LRPISLAILACLAGAGCKRNAPPAPPPLPILGAVTVRDLTSRDDAPVRLDTDAVARAVRSQLMATGAFAADAADGGAPGEDGRGRTRAELQLAVDGAEVGNKGVARARVLVRLDTRPESAPAAVVDALDGAGEQTYAVATAGKHDGAAKQATYQKLVERIAGDLVAGFAARRRLRSGSPDAVHAALTSDGGELRIEAIRAAGERHLTSEAPRLLALLDDSDEATRDAALGALIALGDRRAVTALARSRSLRDRHELHKIIEAISILGGEEADAYLSFLAGSHDDEEIRSEAAAARARMLRRADAGNPP
jgi:hypothetical protein